MLLHDVYYVVTRTISRIDHQVEMAFFSGTYIDVREAPLGEI